jgi:septum formation protein
MLILASSSPRRRELLHELTSNFQVVTPQVDERTIRASDSALPLEISKMKAYEVFLSHPQDTVLACDTIVYFKKRKLGKPNDAEDARAMLRLLSGQTHKVISGYTIISSKFEINRTVVTKVTFNELDDVLIDKYVSSGSPMDKAGAYGIQDKGFSLVKKIEGSYPNVMGLPLEDIVSVIKKLKIEF